MLEPIVEEDGMNKGYEAVMNMKGGNEGGIYWIQGGHRKNPDE